MFIIAYLLIHILYLSVYHLVSLQRWTKHVGFVFTRIYTAEVKATGAIFILLMTKHIL